MSTCVIIKVGDKKVCGKPSKKEFESKPCCTQHFNMLEKEKKAKEFIKDPAAKPAAVAKETPKPATKPAAAPPAAKAAEPSAPASSAASSDAAIPGLPNAVENGICSSSKANGKGACVSKARYTCPAGCHCGSNPMCKTHWKKAHPEIATASGTKAGGRKEVEDEHRCEHLLTSAAKKGQRCANRAYGQNAEGLRSCAQAHGGPKKETVAGTSTSSSGSAAPSGPFSGCDLIAVLGVIIDFIAKHNEDDCEHGCDTSIGLPCAKSVAISWLRELFNLYRNATPSLDDVMLHFTKCERVEGQDEEFSTIFDHSMLYYLKELLGEAHIQWLFQLFSKYSRQAGTDGAVIAAIWKASADELGIKITTFDPPAAAPTEGAAIVSSKKRVNIDNILKKAQQDAESEVKSDVKEEPVEEAKAEEPVVVAEPEVKVEASPATFTLEGLDEE